MSKKPDDFDGFLRRKYGDIIVPADQITCRPRHILPTILSLDLALNGGIPGGSVVFFSGKPKAGKTTLCLHMLKNAISVGRPAFYASIENRTNNVRGLIDTIKGLDGSKLKMIQADSTMLSAQDWLDIIERVIKDNPGAVIVMDSLAMLATIAEQESEIGSSKDMAGAQKLLYSFFRRMKQVIDNNDVILICISHLITNRDPASRVKWVEQGGMAIQYANSIWMSVKYIKLWKSKDGQTRDGQDVVIDIKASALGSPYRPCELPLRFGRGIDIVMDIINNAVNVGLIEKKGAWYIVNGQKYHGLQELRNAMVQDEELLNHIDRDIRSMVLPEAVVNAYDQQRGQGDKDKPEQQQG